MVPCDFFFFFFLVLFCEMRINIVKKKCFVRLHLRIIRGKTVGSRSRPSHSLLHHKTVHFNGNVRNVNLAQYCLLFVSTWHCLTDLSDLAELIEVVWNAGQRNQPCVCSHLLRVLFPFKLWLKINMLQCGRQLLEPKCFPNILLCYIPASQYPIVSLSPLVCWK